MFLLEFVGSHGSFGVLATIFGWRNSRTSYKVLDIINSNLECSLFDSIVLNAPQIGSAEIDLSAVYGIDKHFLLLASCCLSTSVLPLLCIRERAHAREVL